MNWHFDFISVNESQFVLDFPERKISNFIDAGTLPFLTKFTVSFWMKRSYDGGVAQAIFSYSTADILQALFLYRGHAQGALNLRIMTLNRYVVNTLRVSVF